MIERPSSTRCLSTAESAAIQERKQQMIATTLAKQGIASIPEESNERAGSTELSRSVTPQSQSNADESSAAALEMPPTEVTVADLEQENAKQQEVRQSPIAIIAETREENEDEEGQEEEQAEKDKAQARRKEAATKRNEAADAQREAAAAFERCEQVCTCGKQPCPYAKWRRCPQCGPKPSVCKVRK